MSTKPFTIPAKAWTGFKGYSSDKTLCPEDRLAPPSINCLINENGVAECRPGFEAIWDLTGTSAARPFYVPRFDITFFAVGTAVKYMDHNRSNTIVTVAGITLTAGTTTRFAEYAGDVYLTNTTDGVYRIVVSKIATDNALGADLQVESDMGPRLSSFGIGTGDVLVNGTAETYSGVSISATTTLTCTSTAAYSAGAIVLRVQRKSSLPKGSMITFWTERMVIAGVNIADSATDQPTATLHFSKFTTAGTLENIVDFTYGAGGSTMELVGKSGRIKAILATEDWFYVFKENEAYVIDKALVNRTTGQSIPDLRSSMYGCANEDCVVDMGNGEIGFLTNNKRFMRIKLQSDSGQPLIFPDESFDTPIRSISKVLDRDQTLAHLTYHRAKKRMYATVKLDSQWFRIVWDNNIRDWQAPQSGINENAYFERDGVLYGTSRDSGVIHQFDSVSNDNGSPIEFYIATAEFDVGDAQMDTVHVKGSITSNTTIHVNVPVNRGTPADKTIVGSTFSYGIGTPAGAFQAGSSTLGGSFSSTDTAEYDDKGFFDIFPSDANKVQVITYAFSDSAFYSLREFTLRGRRLPTPLPSLA